MSSRRLGVWKVRYSVWAFTLGTRLRLGRRVGAGQGSPCRDFGWSRPRSTESAISPVPQARLRTETSWATMRRHRNSPNRLPVRGGAPSHSKDEPGSTAGPPSSPRRGPGRSCAGPSCRCSRGRTCGRVLDLSGLSVSIGRRSTCSYKIDDPSVSGMHARVTSMSNFFILSDERSTNGTYVNGVRIAEPDSSSTATASTWGASCFASRSSTRRSGWRSSACTRRRCATR